MKKKSKVFVLLLVLFVVLFSAISYAQEETEPCQDVPPWKIWDWTLCKIKAIPNAIGNKIRSAFQGFFDAIISPGEFTKPNKRLYNIFQFIAFTGISLLIVEIGIRLFQSGFNPTNKEIASRQARGIVLMVVLILVGPVLIDFMIEAVKVLSDLIIRGSGTEYSSMIAATIESIGAILGATVILFIVAWPIILAMFLYFLVAVIIRTFMLFALITAFPLIMFLFFWERTRKVGLIFLNLLFLNIFISILWVIIFVMAFSFPEGSLLSIFKPAVLFLTLPLNAYLYFKMSPITPTAFMPTGAFLGGGKTLASVAGESRIKAATARTIGLERVVPKEEIAVERARTLHGVEWDKMSPAEKNDAVQKQYAPLTAKWAEHVSPMPSPTQEVKSKDEAVTVYPIKANELIMFKDQNLWTPQDKRLNQVYMKGESDDFLNYAGKSNMKMNRALKFTSILNDPDLDRDQQAMAIRIAKDSWNKVSHREQDKILDNYEKYKKIKVKK